MATCEALSARPPVDARPENEYASFQPCNKQATCVAFHPLLPRKYLLCNVHKRAPQFRTFELESLDGKEQ